jgi:hypothetical protein
MNMHIPIRPRCSFTPKALVKFALVPERQSKELLVSTFHNERSRFSSPRFSTNVKAGPREDRRPHSNRREALLTIVVLLVGAVAFVILDKWIVPLSGVGHGFI